ncbi:uncharacterized protein LOC116937093 isoform X1 [Petromyzon marinus]|uniref:uncharacterized protein LOC116937093 isoform X1 n=1 Tax=Petromyzon marinus TaxID=7757 RepID=UPI003F72A9CC
MASGFVRTASLYSSSSRRRRRRRLGSLPGSLLAVCVAATAVYAVVTAHEGRGQPQRPSLQDGLPANVTAVVGSDAQLRCVVLKQGGDGGDEHHHQHQQHHHHVQWLKHVEVNGSLEVPNSSPYVRIVTTVGVEVTDVEANVLYLRNVSTDDSGRYTCLAVNAVGFARRSAWLLVVPGETPAGGRTLAATTTSGAGKMLTTSPGRGQPQRPSLQDGLPANVTAVVGSDAQLRCVVLKGSNGGDEHHNNHHHVQWLKHVEVNGSLEAPNGSPYVRIVTTVEVEVTDVETNVLYLRNVSTDDSGRYTCLAVNAVGFARRSAWLLVVPGETPAGGRTLAATTIAGAGKMLTASPAMFPDVSVTVEAVSAAPLTAGDVSCTAGFLLLTAIAGVAAFCLTQTRRARRESTGGEVEMQASMFFQGFPVK